jgi:molybdopterin/thiamine biosynthesis adenylyltransferase
VPLAPPLRPAPRPPKPAGAPATWAERRGWRWQEDDKLVGEFRARATRYPGEIFRLFGGYLTPFVHLPHDAPCLRRGAHAPCFFPIAAGYFRVHLAREAWHDNVDDVIRAVGRPLAEIGPHDPLPTAPIDPRTWGPRRYRAPGVTPPIAGGAGPLDRHEAIGGFSQAALGRTSVLLIGAGGLNARVGVDLGRKGVHRLTICDPDVVDVTNLNRTPYHAGQIGRPKPYALAELLVEMAVAETEILAIPAPFEGCLREGLGLEGTVAVAGVDADATRMAAARWCRERGVPLIVQAVTANADYCSVLVWTPDGEGGCPGCLDPAAAVGAGGPLPCVAGSAVDIVDVSAGLVLYAIDSLVMDRPRGWDLFTVALDGGRATGPRRLPRDADCPICGRAP